MMIKNSVRQRTKHCKNKTAKTAHTLLRPPFWTKEHSICIALDVIKVSIFFITLYGRLLVLVLFLSSCAPHSSNPPLHFLYIIIDYNNLLFEFQKTGVENKKSFAMYRKTSSYRRKRDIIV